MNGIEISVGLPFLKCSSNPSQTVNKKTGKKSKTATTRLVLEENIERKGRDPDIDHSKSKYNVSLGEINTVDEYLKLIEKTKMEVNNKLKEYGKRQLRKDCVDNISIVFKPNIEAFEQFTREEQIRFFKDSKEVTESILNMIFPVFEVHFDEGNTHVHGNGMPLVKDDLGFETFNAKQLLSLKNITKLNREYSQKMREKGWNVKDMNLYEDMTDEEKEEYRKKKKEHGKSSLKYKADKTKELEEKASKLEEDIKDKTKVKNKLEEDSQTILEEHSKIIDEIFKKSKESQELDEEIQQKENRSKKLDDDFKKQKDQEQKELEEIQNKKKEEQQKLDNTKRLVVENEKKAKSSQYLKEQAVKEYSKNHLKEIIETSISNYFKGLLNFIFDKFCNSKGIKDEKEKDNQWEKELNEYDKKYEQNLQQEAELKEENQVEEDDDWVE